jgi:hypothetical protein
LTRTSIGSELAIMIAGLEVAKTLKTGALGET